MSDVDNRGLTYVETDGIAISISSSLDELEQKNKVITVTKQDMANNDKIICLEDSGKITLGKNDAWIVEERKKKISDIQIHIGKLKKLEPDTLPTKENDIEILEQYVSSLSPDKEIPEPPLIYKIINQYLEEDKT